MNNQPTFRSKVFKQAHEMRKSTGNAFSVCLAKAWRAYDLVKQMKTRVVEFSFEKKDGTLRKAFGTLNIQHESRGTKAPNYKAQTYFDTVANGFRSFTVGSLIQIY